MYNILVVGAGYLGTAVATYYASQKQRVFAITRSQSKGEALETQGIHPVIADLCDPESLKEIPPAHFIVICVAPDEGTEEGYRKAYIEAVGQFLLAIKKNPQPALIVYISSTSVWSDDQDGIVDENVAPNPSTRKGGILLDAEHQVLGAGFPSVVFRLSGIYGPTRNRIRSLQESRWPEKGPDRWMNMIHRDDAAAATKLLFKSAKVGEVYIGTDDEPIRRSEFYAELGKQLNISIPDLFDLSRPIQGKQLSNQKLKALEFKFQYPTFRDGYRNLIEAWRRENV